MATSSSPRTAPARAPRPSARPRLAVIAGTRPRRGSAGFVALCTLIIVATLATVLLLNIQMSDTSYRITRLQGQTQTLTEQQQQLQEEQDRRSTPQELEKSARELGMVPAGTPGYVDLGTGDVIGRSDPVAPGGDPATGDSITVPPAEIYQDEQVYHGMGNGGD